MGLPVMGCRPPEPRRQHWCSVVGGVGGDSDVAGGGAGGAGSSAGSR